MRKTLIASLCAAVMASAVAVEISLTPEEQATCKAQGGCMLLSVEFIKEKLQAAFAAGVERGGRECHRQTI